VCGESWHAYTHTPIYRPFVQDYPGEPVPEGKTNLDFTEATDSEWQWHQLGHMQVCTSLQAHNHTSTPPLSFFTGRMPFLPPNQQLQSTEGWHTYTHVQIQYMFTDATMSHCSFNSLFSRQPG